MASIDQLLLREYVSFYGSVDHTVVKNIVDALVRCPDRCRDVSARWEIPYDRVILLRDLMKRFPIMELLDLHRGNGGPAPKQRQSLGSLIHEVSHTFDSVEDQINRQIETGIPRVTRS